jgi:hypothetical protein
MTILTPPAAAHEPRYAFSAGPATAISADS